jgi:hypothetical protein
MVRNRQSCISLLNPGVFTTEECSSIVRDQLSLANHVLEDEGESASTKQN